MDNPRLINLKESVLAWDFTITYNPGKWHRGPDALSRNPGNLYFDIFENQANEFDKQALENIDNQIFTVKALTLNNIDSDIVTIDDINREAQIDNNYKALIKTIAEGFPNSRQKTEPFLREYWEVRDRLFVIDNAVYMDKRIVVPLKFRKYILETLYSAHQGVNGMKNRAHQSVYWPGISTAIVNTRKNCNHCNSVAPSQPDEPIILSEIPEWPFQQICMTPFSRVHD